MAEDFENHEADFVPPPGWPKPIGIISIVLASFGLVCGGIGMLTAPPDGQVAREPTRG